MKCIVIVFLLISSLSVSAAPLLPPDHADVPYGRDDRNKLDIYLAKSKKSTPVVIYFHGGGFRRGDKLKQLDPRLVNMLRDCGITVVSANYRYLTNTSFPVAHEDALRVVQFLRWKATEYNIDAARMGLSGTSAGANMVLWIALHPDMVDGENPDPVKRQSTRVTCAVGYDAQTSNDPHWIVKKVGAWPEMFDSFSKFYGVSVRELQNPYTALKQKIAYASALTHVSKDDPPVFLSYGSRSGHSEKFPETDWRESESHVQNILREELAPEGTETWQDILPQVY